METPSPVRSIWVNISTPDSLPGGRTIRPRPERFAFQPDRRSPTEVRMPLAASIWLISLLAMQDLAPAVAAFEKGNYKDAVRTLSDILRRTPDDPEANYYLGMTYFREGRPEEALPFLERATRLSPSKPAAWKGLG